MAKRRRWELAFSEYHRPYTERASSEIQAYSRVMDLRKQYAAEGWPDRVTVSMSEPDTDRWVLFEVVDFTTEARRG